MSASHQGSILRAVDALKGECKLNLRLKRRKRSGVNLVTYVLFRAVLQGILVQDTRRCRGTFVRRRDGAEPGQRCV